MLLLVGLVGLSCALALHFYHDEVLLSVVEQFRPLLEQEAREDVEADAKRYSFPALPDDLYDTSLIIRERYWPGFSAEALEPEPDFDALVERISGQITEDMAPEAAVKLINGVLYEQLKITAGGMSQNDPRENVPPFTDYCIKDVLRSRKGACVGLTMLYVGLAGRLNLPIHARVTPHHAYARYDDGETAFNIECTNKGKAELDEWYATHFLTAEQAQAYAGHRALLAPYLTNIGSALYEQGRPKEALEAHYWAKALSPELSVPYSGIARGYFDDERFWEALVLLEDALKRDPADLQALFRRLACECNTRDFVQAVATGERLMPFFRKQAKMNMWVDPVADKQEVIRISDDLLADDSEGPASQAKICALVRQCVAMDEFERADLLLKRLKPGFDTRGSVGVNAARSFIAYCLGDFEDARRYAAMDRELRGGNDFEIKHPVALVKQSGEAHAVYAIALNRKGEFDRSAEALHTAGLLIPDNPVFYEAKGDIAYRAEDYRTAVQAYQKALELEPTSEKFQKELKKAQAALERAGGG